MVAVVEGGDVPAGRDVETDGAVVNLIVGGTAGRGPFPSTSRGHAGGNVLVQTSRLESSGGVVTTSAVGWRSVVGATADAVGDGWINNFNHRVIVIVVVAAVIRLGRSPGWRNGRHGGGRGRISVRIIIGGTAFAFALTAGTAG